MQEKKVDSLEIEILAKNIPSEKRYKSGVQMTMMGFIISMSAIMFGYALTQISTIPINTLVQKYHINMPKSLAQGILIGIMPLGGVFGALSFKFVLKQFSRKHCFYFIAIWMLLSVGLIQITTAETIFIGRFFEGIAAGLYVSVGPIYLRQLVARQLRPQLASIYSLNKVIGIVIAYSIEDIMRAAGYTAQSWRILLSFNAVFAVIQVILVFFFLPDSPFEMVQKENYPQAERIISTIYKQQFVKDVLGQMKQEHRTIMERELEFKSSDDKLAPNRKRALLMAVHITTYRQFIGANVLVTFSTQIIEVFVKNPNSPVIYTSLIINCIQLAANGLSPFTVSKLAGRKPAYLAGSIGCTFFNFAIAIGLLLEQQILIIMMMCAYMALFGATYLPIAWTVPSEIIPPDEAVFANVPGWIATSITITVPPIIKAAMPGNNTYPLFFFFGLYGIFGSYVLYKYLPQTKGKTYDQIIKEF